MSSESSRFDRSTTGTKVASTFASAIEGKTILVTGVNKDGLGGKLVQILSQHAPKVLILASRTPAKMSEAIQLCRQNAPSTKFIPLDLDLASQQLCREAAAKVMSNPDIQQIDLVFNNAGLQQLPKRQFSPEGIELHFAVNHIGHFVFTNLIVPKIIAAARNNPRGATRVVNISSRGVLYSPIRFSDLNFDRPHDSLLLEEQPGYEPAKLSRRDIDPKSTYNPLVAYGQSKTANVLFSVGLTSRLWDKYGILSFGIHPGAIKTEGGRYVDPVRLEAMYETFKNVMVSLDQGCATALRAGLDSSLEPANFHVDGKGVYLSECQVADCPSWAREPELAERLWKVSEELVGEKYNF
jgi:NAD(P)-dependent dehydrogenase (short-subunit alcohol dehydrogenase family)